MVASDICHQRYYRQGDEQRPKCLEIIIICILNTIHHYFHENIFIKEYLHQIISLSENIFIEEYLHWIPASAPCVDSIIQYVYHLHLNCKPLIHIKTLLGTYRWRELWKIEMYLLKRLTLLGLNKCRRHIVTTTNWKLGSMWILIIVLDIIDHNLIIIWNPYYHIFYTFYVLLIIVHCKIVFWCMMIMTWYNKAKPATVSQTIPGPYLLLSL